MELNTVIFDIDGLLIDSEPLWNEAAAEVFLEYGVKLTDDQYRTTTGLRTKEFVHWWFSFFKINITEKSRAEREIVSRVLSKIEQKGALMPGVHYLFDFFHNRNCKIGLATSSPPELIDLVLNIAGIRPYIQAEASAEQLPYGKPHPQVYLDCASLLGSHPLECLCFEDSFNGMIAVKAARMKCVIVPHHDQAKEEKWAAADLKISSLQNFGELHFNMLKIK